MRRNTSIILLSAGHACVDVYQGAVAALVPLFVAERAYTYAAASGVVLAATLLSSVAQPLFGALTDRWALPWLLPASTLLGGAGLAAAAWVTGPAAGSYALTLACVALSGIGVAAYHPESARVARRAAAGAGSHVAMGWFSLGGNLGFAAAPVLVAACGLRLAPLLVLPALAGAALCLPVLRALARAAAPGPADPAGGPAPAGRDDRRSFARLAAAVVCRSVAFVGLSTFVALYVRQRLGGGPATGTAALVVLYLGGAAGTVAGGPARRAVGPGARGAPRVPAHRGRRRGGGAGAGPGGVPLRRRHLGRPLHPVLPAGDPRPGLPADPDRHRRRRHAGPDRQRGAGWPPRLSGRSPTPPPCRPRWSR